MCDQCEAMMIQGVYCHETGCPNSDLDANGNPYPKECEWCGAEFVPDFKGQSFCQENCQANYHGYEFVEDALGGE
jgi:hypothetical protein